MSVDYYLAVGSCIVEDGTGTTAYKLTAVALPEPDPDGFGGHLPAVRSFSVRVEGATKAAVKASIATLRRECVRDEYLYWRQDSTGDVLSCRIREASVVEEYHDPIAWAQSTPYVNLTLTLTTDPYWLSPWSSDVTPTVSAVPGHFDVTGVPGEVDALVSMRVVMADAGAGMAVGVKPEPASGYDYLDDYGASGAGTSDSNAYGGYKLASSALTATMAAIGTAPDISTNDNRGRHLVLARADNDVTSQATLTYRAVQRTQGSSIAITSDVAESSVVSPSANLVGFELGDVAIPSAQVPGLDTGTGYAPESVQVEQTTDSGTKTLSSAIVAGGSGRLYVRQSFTAANNGLITAVEYTIDALSHPIESAGIAIYKGDGTLLINYGGELTNFTTGTHKATLSYPVQMVAGESYYFTLPMTNKTNPTFTVGFAYANGAYADGELTTPTGSGESAGDDLLFKVYGQTAVTFYSNTIIQAADTAAASKVANLDYVQRIPVDYAAIVYRLADYSAAPALYYDGDTDTPYIADADGIGPSVLEATEIRKPLRFRPGVTNRVVLGNLQADEALGGATVTYAYRARWLTATGA